MTMGRKAQGCHFHFDIYAQFGQNGGKHCVVRKDCCIHIGTFKAHFEFARKKMFSTKKTHKFHEREGERNRKCKRELWRLRAKASIKRWGNEWKASEKRKKTVKHSILRFSSGIPNEFFFFFQTNLLTASVEKYLSHCNRTHSMHCSLYYMCVAVWIYHKKKKRANNHNNNVKREEKWRIERIKMTASFFFIHTYIHTNICFYFGPAHFRQIPHTHTHTLFVALLFSYSSHCYFVSYRQFDSNMCVWCDNWFARGNFHKSLSTSLLLFNLNWLNAKQLRTAWHRWMLDQSRN